MRLLSILLVLTACENGLKAKSLRLGDVVEFKFAERNLFYSDICKNEGEVIDRSQYGNNVRYMVSISCKKNFGLINLIWIDAEDIVKVLQLGKDRYKD